MIATLRLRRLVATTAVVGALLLPNVASVPTAGAGIALPQPNGYWLLSGNGGVFNFNTEFYGAPASDPTRCPVSPLPARVPQPNGTCWTMTATPNGRGYWVMNSLTGAVYPYGNARRLGDPKTKFAGTSPEFLPVFRQIVTTPDGNGYWVYELGASGLGTVDHFGNAGFFGDTTTLVRSSGGHPLNGQPVAMAATADGKGYWEVYSDGGVFAFGSARFLGSMAGHPLAAPIVGITATESGKGYFLVASDGGVFAFGDAPFAGSRAGLPHEPIIGLALDPTGPGYWLASNNGEIFTFGGVDFFGTPGTFGIQGHFFAITARHGR